MVEFKLRFKDLARITHAETAEQAKLDLQRKRYDLILLDHDLGGEVYVGTDHKNTGSEVARWITENKESIDIANTIFLIHSLNPTGAQYMKKTLERAGIKAHETPGVWLRPTFSKTIII
jgi:CheY-like chemotaxis protein